MNYEKYRVLNKDGILYLDIDGTRRIGGGYICYPETERREATPDELRGIYEFCSRVCTKDIKENAASIKKYDCGVSYTNIFNAWVNRCGYDLLETTVTRNRAGGDTWTARVRIKYNYRRGDRDQGFMVTANGIGTSRVVSLNQVFHHILLKIYVENECMRELYENYPKMFDQGNSCKIVVQSDDVTPEKDNVQGDSTQESDKESNTIITRDQGATESVAVQDNSDGLRFIASSEPTHKFSSIVGRWMPMNAIRLSVSDSASQIKTYKLPEDLFKEAKCASNLIPFEVFVYSRLKMKMKFVVNANKFHCGRVIAAVKFDSYGAEVNHGDGNSLLCRPHILLDLASNNEGELKIPFIYHRAFMRNKPHDTSNPAVHTAHYASVDLRYLSKLSAAADNQQSMDIRPYFMFEDADFAAMSYRVDVQMDSIVGSVAKVGANAIIGSAEGFLHQLKRSINQDKPTDSVTHIVTPRAKSYFPSGRGVDNVTPLQVDPYALTSFIGARDVMTPRTTVDIAKIWGVRGNFKWNVNDQAGKLLAQIPVDPTIRNYGEDQQAYPTPLEMMTGMYNFWSGTIEIRIDFISNAFHTGAIMFSAEFARPGKDMCASSSCYTKTFHLGDQKSVMIRIPYIYDTVMRRSTSMAYDPIVLQNPIVNGTVLAASMGLIAETRTRMSITVVNELKPIAQAPQEIEALVFWRAGPDFNMHGLKQSAWLPVYRAGEAVRSIPADIPSNTTIKKSGSGINERVLGKLGTRVSEVNSYLNAQIDAQHREEEIDLDRLVVNQEKGSGKSRRRPAVPTQSPIEVTTQMDRGDKEDMDDTANFKVGTPGKGIINSDDQTDIMDIIRRPIFMGSISSTAVGALNNVVSIPVRPPSFDYGNPRWAADDKQRFYPVTCQPLMLSNPGCVLLNMHRMWRGSNRFTLVMKTPSTVPVYITYVPHTGDANYIMRKDVQTANSSLLPTGVAQLAPYMAGLHTDVWVPSINPVHTIQAPYETENSWTLMFRDVPGGALAMRDIGDYNAGSILISNLNNSVVDIWWSAGDDFQLANFYGVFEGVCRGWEYSYHDNIQFQMDPGEDMFYDAVEEQDFSFMDAITKVTGVLSENRSLLARTAIGAIPIVGPAYAIAGITSNVSEMTRKCDTITNAAVSTLHKFDNKLNALTNTVTDMSDEIRSTNASLKILIDDGIRTMSGVRQKSEDWFDYVTILSRDIFAKIGEGLKLSFDLVDVGVGMVVDIFLAWRLKSWEIVGGMVMKLLCRIFSVSATTKIMQLADTISTYLRGVEVVVQVDTEENNFKTMVAAVVAFVGTVMGVGFDPYFTGYARGLMRRITSASGVSYINGTIRFVTGLFDCVKELIMKALGYVTPEAGALQMLSGQGSVVDTFVNESQIVMNEANNCLLVTPLFRARAWRVVMQAYQLQRLLQLVPRHAASFTLSKICSDVIKFGSEKFVDMASCPVRYEPYVICIEGNPKIGKSFMTDKVVALLLNEIGFDRPTSGDTYIRSPGSRYWSGYRDQPAVVYDDWLNMSVSELVAEQVAELYKLKSTAVFVPEMAHLEEKKIKANPLLVIMNTNEAFPRSQISSVCPNINAVYRRRDVVLHARIKPDYVGQDLRSMSDAESEVCAHLEFCEYSNVMDKASKRSEYFSFEETIHEIRRRFAEYHAQEQIAVKKRLQTLFGRLQQPDMEHLNLNDPFELFYNSSLDLPSQTGVQWVPSEALAMEVMRINEVIRAHQIPEPQSDAMKALVAGGLMGGAVLIFLRQLGMWMDPNLYDMEDMNFYIRHPGPIRTCCICLDEKECTFVCRDTFVPSPEVGHFVCGGCAVRLTDSRCPACRSPGGLVRCLRHDAVMGIFGWIRSLSPTEIMHAINTTGSAVFCNLVRCGLVGRLMSLIKLIRAAYVGDITAFVVESVVASVDSVWDSARIFSRYVNFPSFRGGTRQVIEQADSDAVPAYGMVPDETDTPNLDVYDLDLEYIERNLRNVVTPSVSVCFHRDLRNQLAMVRWISGRWWIPVVDSNVGVYVEDRPCDCNCIWEDMQEQIGFYEDFRRRNSRLVSNRLAHIVNGGDINLPPGILPWWFRNRPSYQNLTRSNWWDYIGEVWEKYKPYIMVLGGIAAAGGALAMIYGSTENGDGQSSSRGTPRVQRTPRRTLERGVRYELQVSAENQPLENVVIDKIVHNMFVVDIAKDDKLLQRLAVQGLYGHYGMMPKHYLPALRNAKAEGKTIHGYMLRSPTCRKEYNFDDSDFKCSEDHDIAVWRIPNSFNMFKDIRGFIATETDMEKPISHEGKIVCVPTRFSDYPLLVDVDIDGVTEELFVGSVDESGNKILTIMHDVVKYNFSRSGACSSLLVVPNSQRPIISMHVAGYSGDGYDTMYDGYGIPLCREYFGDLFDHKVSAEIIDVQLREEHTIVFQDSKVEYLGGLEKSQITHVPNKTKIKPSLLYNKFGFKTTTEPAILHKNDLRYTHDVSPLIAGCEKHGKLTEDFQTSQINRAGEAYWDLYLTKMKPLVAAPKRLNIEQACVGLEDIPYYEPIDLKTSAGFPWSATGKSVKEHYIDFVRRADERPVGANISECLRNTIVEKEELRKKGVIPFTVFVDMLKDERRKLEKLMKRGGTRVICMSPMDYVIAARQNMLHFTAAFMHNRHDLLHAVGVNPHGLEWSKIARKLNSINSRGVFTLDYSNFGPGFNAGVAAKACELMKRWILREVAEIDELELDVIMHECLNSIHACHDTIYTQQAGSPSGGPFTTIINTLVNILYILIAWEALCGNDIDAQQKNVWEEFVKQVGLYTYGDDLVGACKDYLEKFNAKTITDYFARYKITTTDATKREFVTPYHTIFEAEFLKSGFRIHPTKKHVGGPVWLSSMQWEVIEEIPQWVRSPINMRDSTQENAITALLFAHGHGPQKFLDFKEKLNVALNKTKCSTVSFAWEEIDRIFFPTLYGMVDVKHPITRLLEFA